MSRLAEEGLLMAYGATEPAAGSDLGALKTHADPVQSNGAIEGYRISGAKQWISNGGFADLYSILAMAPGGPSWFVVEAGTEGLSHGKPEQKHGIRASNTASVLLDDVYVPAAQLLGEVEGQGLIQAQRVFGYTRLMVASFGIGCGWAALDRAIEFVSKQGVLILSIRPDGSMTVKGSSTPRAPLPSTSAPKRVMRRRTPPFRRTAATVTPVNTWLRRSNGTFVSRPFTKALRKSWR
jgi:alkylation response protein AidB-like acyl-CoA dehydrogenase